MRSLLADSNCFYYRRVSCGGWHTMVVTKSGACYAFGRGEYGRLGLGNTKSRTHPHLVSLKLTQVSDAGTFTNHRL